MFSFIVQLQFLWSFSSRTFMKGSEFMFRFDSLLYRWVASVINSQCSKLTRSCEINFCGIFMLNLLMSKLCFLSNTSIVGTPSANSLLARGLVWITINREIAHGPFLKDSVPSFQCTCRTWISTLNVSFIFK